MSRLIFSLFSIANELNNLLLFLCCNLGAAFIAFEKKISFALISKFFNLVIFLNLFLDFYFQK